MSERRTFLLGSAALLVCIAAIAGFFALLSPPPLAGSWEFKEAQRYASPDGKVEAVLVSGNGGATTSLMTSIYLVPRGSRVNQKESADHVFSADHTNNLTIAWRHETLLEIGFQEARIYHFKNYWSDGNLKHIVEVMLAPQSNTSWLSPRDRVW